MTRKPGYALLTTLLLAAVIASVLLFDSDPTTGSLRRNRADGRAPVQPASSGRWIGTWSTPMVSAEPGLRRGLAQFSLRNLVHISIGGTAVRIHLSNAFGDKPLTIDRASVAMAAAPGSADALPGTLRPLRFQGRTTITIPAGGAVVSDSVQLTLPAAADLLVSTFSAVPAGTVSYHPFARQTSFLALGDHTAEVSGRAFTARVPHWRYLSAVDVWATSAQGAVAALGDSITAGVRSTPDANARWTDFLARRMATTQGAPRLGVLNQGIGGNRILVDGTGRTVTTGRAGLTRMRLDVLALSGVSVVVVELGVNDILKDPNGGNPQAIVQGLRTLTALAHGRGLRVVGATLTPFGGHRGYSPQRELVRQQVNAQIRAGGVFDAVVDFDQTLSDPSAPTRLLPRYDSGDHLHPNDAGNQAMANALDLTALQPKAPAKL